MTEDEVREIVRDELATWIAAQRAREDQAGAESREAMEAHQAVLRAQTEPHPDDGPIVAKMKRTLRGEE